MGLEIEIDVTLHCDSKVCSAHLDYEASLINVPK